MLATEKRLHSGKDKRNRSLPIKRLWERKVHGKHLGGKKKDTAFKPPVLSSVTSHLLLKLALWADGLRGILTAQVGRQESWDLNLALVVTLIFWTKSVILSWTWCYARSGQFEWSLTELAGCIDAFLSRRDVSFTFDSLTRAWGQSSRKTSVSKFRASGWTPSFLGSPFVTGCLARMAFLLSKIHSWY